MNVADLLIKAVTEGGPFALSVVFCYQWWSERRENKRLNSTLLDLATAQIEATVKQEAAIQVNTKLMERFMDR